MPDRYPASAGTFSTTQPVFIADGCDLCVDNAGSGNTHTMSVTYRGGKTATRVVGPGEHRVFQGQSIASVAIDSGDASTLWEQDVAGSFQDGTNTRWVIINSNVTTVPIVPTLIEDQSFDGAITAGTADAVSTAGTVAIPVGALVNFRLTVGASLATAADPQTYVAIVGNTSGTVYAKAYASNNGSGAVSGAFRLSGALGAVGAAEKLDIHTRNADTVTHLFTAAWDAWTSV